MTDQPQAHTSFFLAGSWDRSKSFFSRIAVKRWSTNGTLASRDDGLDMNHQGATLRLEPAPTRPSIGQGFDRKNPNGQAIHLLGRHRDR